MRREPSAFAQRHQQILHCPCLQFFGQFYLFGEQLVAVCVDQPDVASCGNLSAVAIPGDRIGAYRLAFAAQHDIAAGGNDLVVITIGNRISLERDLAFLAALRGCAWNWGRCGILRFDRHRAKQQGKKTQRSGAMPDSQRLQTGSQGSRLVREHGLPIALHVPNCNPSQRRFGPSRQRPDDGPPCFRRIHENQVQ